MASPLAHTCQPRPPIRDVVVVVNVAATLAAFSKVQLILLALKMPMREMCECVCVWYEIQSVPQYAAIRNWNWNWNWFISSELLILIHFDTLEPGNELSIETIVNDDDANRNWTHNLTWNFLIILQYDLLGGVLNNIAINWLWQVHDKRSWVAVREKFRMGLGEKWNVGDLSDIYE